MALTQNKKCYDVSAGADGSSVFMHVGKSSRGVHLSSEDVRHTNCPVI